MKGSSGLFVEMVHFIDKIVSMLICTTYKYTLHTFKDKIAVKCSQYNELC